MTRLIPFWRSVLLVICAIASAGQITAQEPSPTPTRLALEIKYYPGLSPAFQAIKQASQAAWSWYGRFARINPGKPSPEAAMVKAVHVTSYLEADAVRVIISVLSGERGLDYRQRVAEYIIRETEEITVEELRQFGIQPFEIKLVRVPPTQTLVPPVVLKGITALMVVDAAAYDSTLPSYRISLLNQSTKNVIALGVDVVANGKRQTSGMPRDPEAKPLIQAGKVYELSVAAPVRARETSGGYEPSTLADQEIEIKAVVFDDETFEGDPAVAASIKSFKAIEKKELLRVIPLLEKAIASSAGVSESLRTLEHNVRFPDGEGGYGPLDNAANDAQPLEKPAVREIKESPEVFYPPIRAALMQEIRRLLSDGSLDETKYEAWLTATKRRYESWLSRL